MRIGDLQRTVDTTEINVFRRFSYMRFSTCYCAYFASPSEKAGTVGQPNSNCYSTKTCFAPKCHLDGL